MRICVFTPDRPEQGLNGPRRIAGESARALAALGHDVHLIGHAQGTPGPTAGDGFWHHQVEIVDRGLPGLEGSAAAMDLYAAAAKHRAVLELHASTPVDLVVASIWPGEGLICLLDDRLATVTVLVTPVKLMIDRGMLSGEPYRTMARIERAVVRRSAYVHGTSGAIATDVEGTFGVKLPRCESASLFMVDRAARPGYERYAPPGETEVLFVGRAEPRKGTDVLLAAARLGPQAAYVLVGPGSWESLRSDLESDERLTDRVSLLGEVDEARLWRLYAGADIVVVPSRYESFGYPLIEAMMFGKAIVATDVGGMPEVVEPGGNALLCAPDDPQALADAISQLVEDADRRAAFGRRSRELYEQRYSVDVGGARTAALYERMAADHRRIAPAAPRPLIELLTEAVAEITSLEEGVAGELAHTLLTDTGPPTVEPRLDWARRAKAAEDRAQLAEERAHDIERRHAALQDQIDILVSSHSWRLTRPLRALRGRERRRHPDRPAREPVPTGDTNVTPGAVLTPMISYAQNYEDVVLRRAVGQRANGFYVDIGAADPVINSVTNHFYARGWSGINVEPEPGAFARLAAARPRDINLNLAIASQPGRLPLSVISAEPELSTIEPAVAQRYSGVFESSLLEVAVERLDDVLSRHATRPIDFLKIDVEGAEADALASFDLERWGPAVLIVEATQPNSPLPNHQDWEPTVMSAGYELALFDGVNCFYARAGDRRTLAALRVPANWFDQCIQYRWWVALTPEARDRLRAEGYRD